MKTIAEILETKKADMRELEKFLYDNPEIEMEEFKAKEKFIELLEKEGFEIEKDIEGLPTAFVAHKSNGEGPSIGICSEYDAPARDRPRLRSQPHRRYGLRRGGDARRVAAEFRLQGKRLPLRHAGRGDGTRQAGAA